MNNYVTVGDLSSSINGLFDSTSSLSTSLNNYVLNTSFISSNTYLISRLSNLDTHMSVTDQVLANFQSDFISSNTNFNSQLSNINNNYYNQTTTNSLLLLKSNQNDMISSFTNINNNYSSLVGYVNNLNNNFSNYYTTSQTTNLLSGYETKTALSTLYALNSDLISSNSVINNNISSLSNLLVSSTSSLNANQISGFSNIINAYQPLLSNVIGITNCSYLYAANKLKVLTLVSATTILDSNAFIHKNDYLSMIESYDNKKITFDINEPYRNTITSLSSIFCRQSDFITLQNTLTSVSSLSSNYTTITQTSVLNNTLNTYIYDQNIRNLTYANQTEVETFYNSLPDLFYTQSQSDSLYISSSLINTLQPRIFNTIAGAISILNETNNRIKTLTLVNAINVFTNDKILHQNEYLELSETSDSIIIDIKGSYRHTYTSLTNLFYTKNECDELFVSSGLNSFQPRLSNNLETGVAILNESVNKIKSLSLINGVTTYTGNSLIHQNNYLSFTENNNNISLDLRITSLSSLYNPILSNGTSSGAYILQNNKIKNINVSNGISDLSVGGTINHYNSYLSLIESPNDIIIDINPSYLHTTSSLSNIYYTQTSTTMLFQPKISTNSTLNFNRCVLGGSTTSTSVLNIKGVTTSVPALILHSGATNAPSATIFYQGSYNDIIIAPGDFGGCTRVNNLCSYQAIVIGNGAANTTALTPAVLKNIICKQATSTFPSGVYYAVDITSCFNALAGLTFLVGTQRCNNIEGLLALLIANMQYIFTNLKAAGIAGFTTY